MSVRERRTSARPHRPGDAVFLPHGTVGSRESLFLFEFCCFLQNRRVRGETPGAVSSLRLL